MTLIRILPISFTSAMIFLSSFAKSQNQDSASFIAVYSCVNKSSALPLDYTIRDRPDYLRQNDNLNTSLNLLYGIKAMKHHYFIIGMGYENRFTYTDTTNYFDYCGSQIVELSKVYVRNINSVALTTGLLFKPVKSIPSFGMGIFLNVGITLKSWYKENVTGFCGESKSYYEDSNGNTFLSPNVFFQYDFLRERRFAVGLICKFSYRTYRFFFSDLNYGVGIKLKFSFS